MNGKELAVFSLSKINHDAAANVDGGIWASMNIVGNPEGERWDTTPVCTVMVTKSGGLITNWHLPKYMPLPRVSELIAQAEAEVTADHAKYHGPVPSIRIVIQDGMITDVYADDAVSIEIIDTDSDDPDRRQEANDRLSETEKDPRFRPML